jgi:hypothetical protein
VESYTLPPVESYTLDFSCHIIIYEGTFPHMAVWSPTP